MVLLNPNAEIEFSWRSPISISQTCHSSVSSWPVMYVLVWIFLTWSQWISHKNNNPVFLAMRSLCKSKWCLFLLRNDWQSIRKSKSGGSSFRSKTGIPYFWQEMRFPRWSDHDRSRTSGCSEFSILLIPSRISEINRGRIQKLGRQKLVFLVQRYS